MVAFRNRRRLVILTIAAVLIGVVIIATMNKAVVTEDAYESIKRGASRREVGRVLGNSHGDNRHEFTAWLNNRSPRIGQGSDLLNGTNREEVEYWYQDSGVIIIDFDDKGRVVDKEFLHIDVSTVRQGIARTLQRYGF